jgi:hypothetical protein
VAAVSDTAATGISYTITIDRTFVAGTVNHFNYIATVLISAHGELYTFFNYCPLAVDAAAHRGLWARNDFLWYVVKTLYECVALCQPYNFG